MKPETQEQKRMDKTNKQTNKKTRYMVNMTLHNIDLIK